MQLTELRWAREHLRSVRVCGELPLFEVQLDRTTYWVAPGRAWRRHEKKDPPPEAVEHAHKAQRQWQMLAEDAYAPTCLTLYLSNRCNLACTYCFASHARTSAEANELLQIPKAAAAARLVAAHCRDVGRPLTVVLHGGGEPTLHWHLLTQLVEATRRVASEFGIEWWGYLATNGVLSERRAWWLGQEFDLIGLSCDGPAALHDAQRPTGTGLPTSQQVKRTARALHRAGATYVVRTTVLPQHFAVQREVVSSLHEELLARTVRLEPAYGVQAGSCQVPAQADAFVEGFLEARRWGEQAGVSVETSACRPEEIHAAFCNPLRQVLQLTPDGRATACFLETGGVAAAREWLTVGAYAPSTQEFEVDATRLVALKERLLRRPARCHHCFASLHCAGECPDRCLVKETDEFVTSGVGGFRCRVSLGLAVNWLRRFE